MASHRLTLRVSDTLQTQLVATAHQQGTTVSDIVRQALAQTYTAPAGAPHMPSDCASVVLRECLPEAQDCVYEAAQVAGVDIATVMQAILHCWLRTQPEEAGGSPVPRGAGSTLRSPAWAWRRRGVSSSRGGALAPGAAVMTVESFGVEERLKEELVLRPPALDLGVDSRLVGQGLAPALPCGVPLVSLPHLDVVQGFRNWASAEVLPADAALMFHAAVEITLVPAPLPGHVYYLLRRAPEVAGPHCEERRVP